MELHGLFDSDALLAGRGSMRAEMALLTAGAGGGTALAWLDSLEVARGCGQK
jgi:hypothetical protein